MGPIGVYLEIDLFLQDGLTENDRNYGQENVRFTLNSGHWPDRIVNDR